DKVEDSKFTAESFDYISQAFKEDLSKLIIERIADENTIDKALQRLSTENFNYLCFPGGENGDNLKIASFIKEQRKNNKVFKAVLPNTQGDNEGIINYVSTCTDENGKTYPPEKFVSRIASVLASIPFSMSSTYYELKDIVDTNIFDNPNGEIDNGKLILIKDDGVVKIGRGVNSLTTVNKDKQESFKKIRIIEILDMVKDDIYRTMKKEYIGKISNTYDNKMNCIGTINSYLKELQNQEILGDGENRVDIDLESHKQVLRDKGYSEDKISNMSETELRKVNTGSYFYVKGSITPIDSIEDIRILFNI
ncbi:MAG TPA: phage tail sheath protein, partial [Candidatus Dwaynia gallinarum]|nr:phage tail sheath protein [Candidatus Dwaynia gallinarum]